MIAMRLIAAVVSLQLDVSARGEEAGQQLQRLLGRRYAAAAERMGERPFIAACEAVQPGRVLLDELPREARLSFRPVLRAGSEKLAEVPVALAVLDEEAESGAVIGMLCIAAVFKHQFSADERPDTCLLRRHEEARRSIDAIALDEGHGRNVVRCCMRDEVLRERGGVEEGEGGCRSELSVGTFRGLRSSYRRVFRLPTEDVVDVGEVVVLTGEGNGSFLRFLRARVARDAEVAGGRGGHGFAADSPSAFDDSAGFYRV